jgi:hypothetical protein
MLDLSYLPSQKQDTIIFYATSGSTWQTWNKPRNAKLIEIFCLGSGAGGSTGGAGGTARNGGTGGGGAGIVRGIIPAFLIPDNLYIQVAKGGAGGISGGGGEAGNISYVGTQPSASEQTLICKSSTTAAAASTTAATISTVALSAFGNLGLFTAIAGIGGSGGGAGAGASQTALGASLVTGGASGGGKGTGTFTAGGNINSASAILTSQVNGGVNDGQRAADGYGTLIPFCGTGGAGGAGSAVTGAGTGGNGFYGCGGGGSGAGTTTTGVRGGNGGDGLVIITAIY